MTTPRDWLDRLIDILLREELGREQPPDLTERVLIAAGKKSGRTTVPKSRFKPWVWGGAAAIAVSLFLAVGWFAYTRIVSRRPEVAGTGLTVEGGGKLERGAVVRSNQAKGQLSLGDYCEIELEPNSSVRIGGTQKQEQLTLLQGVVSCRVESNRGGFSVNTPHGQVVVTGTQFTVRLLTGRGPDGKPTEWTQVKVEEGRVSMIVDGTPVELQPTDSRRFPLPADPFAAKVASLPVQQRAAAVMAKVQELNPRFHGRFEAEIAEGEVRDLTFETDDITDLSPLQALPYLWTLKAEPSPGRRGRLENIAPLHAHWELVTVSLSNNPIENLAPLKDKPLVMAQLNNTLVLDLTPLRGKDFAVAHFSGSQVRDLSPLRGLAITEMSCGSLDGVELDLTPIAAAPLDRIWCDGPTGNNIEILRRIPTLRIVNNQPAAAKLRR
jgi:hypothetical protein